MRLPEQVQEIRSKCQKVLEKIKKGEDFGEMAILYSEDASAKDRGDLGYFKRGDLLPAFEKEALRLKVGEIERYVSGPNSASTSSSFSTGKVETRLPLKKSKRRSGSIIMKRRWIRPLNNSSPP